MKFKTPFIRIQTKITSRLRQARLAAECIRAAATILPDCLIVVVVVAAAFIL